MSPEKAGRDGTAGATLTIDFAALAANWRLLAERSAPAECAAVVKANAYGIGIEPAVRALANAGCRTFFVATVAEGTWVRALAAQAVIYILDGLLRGAETQYLSQSLRPVLGSMDEVERWAAAARGAAVALPAAIHIDTGMNRLGLAPAVAARLLADGVRPAFPIAHIMSHFVSAERGDDPLNQRQIGAFEAVRRLVPDVPASMANSSGIFLGSRAHFDLVRPGYALYGGNPTPGKTNPMRPVVGLSAEIILCRTVEAGSSVGYNAEWRAERRSRLATIGVGYADGYPRSASATQAVAGGAAVVGGVRCAFAGRVSMDLIVIDVTDAPEHAARPGEQVELIGAGITVDDVGAFAGTSGYEILTNLGRRYRRINQE